MRDEECVRFLQWALPRLGMSWAGYRKVRRQVCRRVARRIAELRLPDVASYRARLEEHPGEWEVLDGLTHITISRFHRDREVFDALRDEVLPALARSARAAGRTSLGAWSAGAAGGEEPYTLALMWNLDLADRCGHLALRILATDVEDSMLARANAARYDAGSLEDVPERWRRLAFTDDDGGHRLRPEHRTPVTFERHDLRGPAPASDLDLVLCRYLAFTYFDAAGRMRVARTLAGALRRGGALILGTHEAIPDGIDELEPWPGRRGIHRLRP